MRYVRRVVIPALCVFAVTGLPVYAQQFDNVQVAQREHTPDTQRDEHRRPGPQEQRGGQYRAPDHRTGAGQEQGVVRHRETVPGRTGTPVMTPPPARHEQRMERQREVTPGTRQIQIRREHARPSPTVVEPFRGPREYTPGRRPADLNNRPRHYDPRDYHHNYQAERRYHWRPYVRPRGWYYHRWVFGEFLPRIFWVRDYWIFDYWMFGLPVPPWGCVWVRYGDDAVLIDTRTGVILQVIYGIFY